MKKLLLLIVLFSCLALIAQENEIPKELTDLEAKLHYQQGEIDLRSGLAKLTVPENFRYLAPADADIVLTEMWGNPKGNDTLGMLIPSDLSPLDQKCWAVIITYADDGYVKDSDADKIDYSDLLKKMQKATLEYNKEREKEGYPPMTLVGWATPPRYDKATHKMYWAKELSFPGAEENTLNYNIRVLGRRGVLVLNAVAAISDLKIIEEHTPAIVGMIDFRDGNRYADFNGKTDKVAEYGLAGLIAGAVAMKAGLFKAIWLALLAAKKFVIIGAVALFGMVKKLFGKKEKSETTQVGNS